MVFMSFQKTSEMKGWTEHTIQNLPRWKSMYPTKITIG